MIRITRQRGWADNLRAYRVLLDGQIMGEIREGEIRQFPAAAGHHSLQLTVDWCRSRPVEFEVEDSAIVDFECASNVKGWVVFAWLLYVLLWRNNYIRLERR